MGFRVSAPRSCGCQRGDENEGKQGGEGEQEAVDFDHGGKDTQILWRLVGGVGNKGETRVCSNHSRVTLARLCVM